MADYVYDQEGYCPVCEGVTAFLSLYDWYRDHLRCSNCSSIPRERALALVLNRYFPHWRSLVIHESSPGFYGLSRKLKRQCLNYKATHFYPREPRGNLVEGFRNENLESQTFEDESFDLVITQDVMEHLNDPATAVKEIVRTLRSGGAYIFTVPTYTELRMSERRALLRPDGVMEYFGEPEYHGNPISSDGSLVFFRYGRDLPELMHDWANLDVEVVRFHDHHHGIIGEFTDVYVARMRSESVVGIARDRVADDVNEMCVKSAENYGVCPVVHRDDFIFRFVYDNSVFPSKQSAVDYYFSDGSRSWAKLRVLIGKHMPSDSSLTILEFAAGYGAVTRHAIRELSPHTLHSSDIHVQANHFLGDVLGVKTVQSVVDPEYLVFPIQYDVIFVLSFFSHLPRATWSRWLKALYDGLRPGGILLFTTHGESSQRFFPLAVLDETGFWYDESSEQADLDTSTYGQTVCSRIFVDKQIADLPGVEYVLFEPAAWWEHQDLYIVRRLL